MSESKKSKRKHSKSSKKGIGLTSVPDEDELNYLEKIILGTGSEPFQELRSDDESEEETSSKKRRDEEVDVKKPAWVDEDDDATFDEVIKKQQRRCVPGVSGSKKYQKITEQKYQQIMGVPKWSKLQSGEKSASDDLLSRCGQMIKKPKYLNKGEVEIKKLKDLNIETHAEGPFINVVKFHPKSTVAMVAGVSGIVSLFQVDGKKNTKLQSIQFQKYPIHCGAFLKNGEEFLIGSQHFRYFYSHNLISGHSKKIDNAKISEITKTKNFCVSPSDNIIAVCGNHGKIFLFAVTTKEFIGTLQMNCNVTALDFNNDGSVLYSHGEDGEVYMWDMNSRSCVKKFFDDGCLTGTSISISQNDQLIACGSSSGVVNIYNTENIDSANMYLPTKTLYNLVTPVTSVKFNSSCEILAFSSNHKDNAVKLVHCPSMTVFSNFPSFSSKMKKPLCLDFSPNSGYFALGDNKGSAHLFRLKYYGNY